MIKLKNYRPLGLKKESKFQAISSKWKETDADVNISITALRI